MNAVVWVGLSLALSSMAVSAQTPGADSAFRREAGAPASSVPAPLREIGFDQHLDQPLPLDVPFNDESGRRVRLAEFFGTRPVVLVFAYFDCPMLCTQVINGLLTALSVLSLEPGKDFEILTVSFNPRDTPASAAAKKRVALERYRQPGGSAAWHFLTGDQPSIDRLTLAAGFRYVWDAATGQFAHPTGIMVTTPDGRLARYLFGIEYGPRDLRFALVDASAGKVGNPVDTLLLSCYHYDPLTGRYGLVIMRVLRVVAATSALALASFIVVMLQREHLTRRTQHPAPSTQHPAPAPSTEHPAPSTVPVHRGPR